MTPRPEDFRREPIRDTPWPRALLTADDRAAIVALLPKGHWMNVSGKSPKGPFLAVHQSPQGEVARGESGLPVVACLRALGADA